VTFNSLQFLIFFPIVASIHFVLPYRWRWLWLLVASCVFYMAFIPVYILVLFILIVIDYTAALLIERAEGRARRVYLLVSIVATCAVLFVFKYFNFFNANLARLAELLHWNYKPETLGLILPIGLSFHTFQSLNYVIEVYRRHFKAERRFGIYALYVMFFPQLVAGPIERAKHLLPQFDERHDFDYTRVTQGLKLMLWGMFQKVVIADRLALAVNQVYGNLSEHQGPALVIATVFFAFQIYCDFAGYSDIAIGAAQVLGFRLMQNFRRPYLAESIADFWHRWHISLSTWFRDYVYISLGGSRVSAWGWHVNIMVTFLLSGLWHGANWTFLVWGGLHGLYYLISRWSRGIRAGAVQILGLERQPAVHRFLRRIIVFVLVCAAWVFFRASSMGDAVYIFSHLTAGWGGLSVHGIESAIGLSQGEFVFSVGLILLVLGLQVFQEASCAQNDVAQELQTLQTFFSARPVVLRWAVYLACIWTVMNLGVSKEIPFIYFQF